ncbi:PINc/VapC family ATPase [Thermoproteota archaeon]
MANKETTTNIEKLVPDTSIIIEGILSRKLNEKALTVAQVLIHEAVIAELEHQANENRETGHLGLKELKRLQGLSKEMEFELAFAGKKPSAVEIQHAKIGEIDALIRDLAYENDATLYTADKIQASIAEVKGMRFILEKLEARVRKLKLETFFDETTMSVHLRESIRPYAKKGRPGEWQFVEVRKKELTRDEVRDIANEIVEEAGIRKDGFLEIERPGSTIVQLSNYRIVITKPPFSDGWEITAVRPVTKLSLTDYELPDKVQDRIAKQAEGILIAGAPGQGKSTFAQALAEYYASQQKVVKTVEAPRDLQLPDSVTQYAISHGSPQEIHDVLLLSRPDYTIFDEMRNTEDFRLFADMRLSGVGMIGIVHATNAIDAIQRFIGRIELGVIPQIIDTVLFIKDGTIAKIFEVVMQVKVPAGMTEEDLARPVITVKDFQTGKLEFELYSYGEETVVVPVSETQEKHPLRGLAEDQIKREMQKYSHYVDVDVVSDHKCIVRVPEEDIGGIIGKQGATIDKIQKKLGIHIDVEPIEGKVSEQPAGKNIAYETNVTKRYLEFFVGEEHKNTDVDIYINDEFIMQARAGKKGLIRIHKLNKIGKSIINSIQKNDKIELYD